MGKAKKTKKELLEKTTHVIEEPIGELLLEQKKIEDCEWCFQFDNDEPQIFAWTDPDMENDEDPTVSFTISNVEGAYISFTHSKTGKSFKLFARELSEDGKSMREKQREAITNLQKDIENASENQEANPNAVVPKYAKLGDAGMDLVATSIISDTPEQITYGMGVALEIPEGFVGLIFPRSSIRKTGLQQSNSVGVCDSGYRGELQATFNKIFGGERMYDEMKVEEIQPNEYYKVGDRIAQIMIIPYPPIEFVEVDDLSTTERGEGGFGSTGK